MHLVLIGPIPPVYLSQEIGRVVQQLTVKTIILIIPVYNSRKDSNKKCCESKLVCTGL